MYCDVCEDVIGRYRAAVAALHSANQHLRQAKLGTLQSALARREVHSSLEALIASDAEVKTHRASHIGYISAIPEAHNAAF